MACSFSLQAWRPFLSVRKAAGEAQLVTRTTVNLLCPGVVLSCLSMCEQKAPYKDPQRKLQKVRESGYLQYDSNYMTFRKSKTIEIIKKIKSVVARGWGRRDK